MNRQAGSLLLELAIALSVLTIGLLGFFSSFYADFRAGDSTAQRDEAALALDNVTELLRSTDLEGLYGDYNGTSIEVPGLDGPYGQPARVDISCYVDETSLPPAFGPILDLDGKGGLATVDCSGSYKLLPIRLSVTFLNGNASETREIYIVIGQGVNT